ncbi:hypothetical protein OOT46_15315 [Aquabacterium sp. A7-Y]|uniref:hypothetical protein n=1 Tax=Aquabacterium sp. A7-Y TaxID=1349605 RepID=UPI00223C93A1|nr:hypothetical protein [Aquabacterium sp. A7-Y]MCW7539212.1 hypothetical protein [Aquabacterium sp. A7-Y]
MYPNKKLLSGVMAALLAAGGAYAQSAQTDTASPPTSGTQQNIGNSQGNASQTGPNATQDASGTRSMSNSSGSASTTSDAYPSGSAGDQNVPPQFQRHPASNLQGPVGEGEATEWWPGKDSATELDNQSGTMR